MSIMQLSVINKQRRTVAEVDALKRLQAETAVNRNTGRAAAELDTLLPAILD